LSRDAKAVLTHRRNPSAGNKHSRTCPPLATTMASG